MKLRIEDAIKYAKSIGREVNKTDIAKIMYKTKKNCVRTQRQNLSHYLKEDTEFVRIDWIIGICELCGCSTDFLIGRKNKVKDLEQTAKPLMDYLADNNHPHCTAIVTATHAEILEGLECFEDSKNTND